MTGSEKLIAGSNAPHFSAVDQSGTTHALSQYAGKYVLLYFYPQDDTPGCTIEACSFRDHYPVIRDEFVVLGVSADDQASHDAFAKKFQLPFPLLVDTDKTIITAYGADGVTYPKRTSFLISPTGIIQKVYDSIDVNTHVERVRQDLHAIG